jgi:hypothetical protein
MTQGTVRAGRTALLAAIGFTLGITGVSAQDRVEVNTGNTAVGEVDGLRQGKLDFDADGMGVVSIETADILFLESPRQFEILMLSNERIIGSIGHGPSEGTVTLDGRTYQIQDIALLRPVDRSFWGRTGGFVDVGFSAAKANNNRTLNTAAEARYDGLVWQGSIGGSNYYQDQDNTDQTQRTNYYLNVGRRLRDVWLIGLLSSFDSNDELNLDYRLQGGFGGARPVTRSRWLELTFAASLLAGSEAYGGEDTNTNSVEIGLQTAFDAFRYNTPELDHRTTFTAFPSLTQSGRYRLELNTRTSYEVFSDFFVALTFKDSYDSAPPSKTAENNDWTLSFSVGWSW